MNMQEQETEKCPYCDGTDIFCHVGLCTCHECGEQWSDTTFRSQCGCQERTTVEDKVKA